jgi:hypothetical protein
VGIVFCQVPQLSMAARWLCGRTIQLALALTIKLAFFKD